MSRVPLAVFLALGWTAFVVRAAEPAPPPRVIPLAELVAQLASDDFAEREAAEKRLSAIALDPPAEVVVAMKSADPELRERARRVALAMRLNVAAARLPRGEAFATQGRADLFIAATAVWDLKADDPRLWEPALRFGHIVLQKAGADGKARPGFTRDPQVLRAVRCPSFRPEFAALKGYTDLRFTRVNDVYRRFDPPKKGYNGNYYPEAIQAPGVQEARGVHKNLIVSRGSVQVATVIDTATVFANGSITTGAQVSEAIIVCDGDVEVGEFINQSVVVARGNIRAKLGAATCTLIAGGKVILNNQDLHEADSPLFNKIKENYSNPLGFITFFELHRVGLEVKAVTVAKVAPQSAVEKAGLKVGDTILEVNGTKPTDAESLRRLLRDALAVGDAAVKVRRGADTLTLKLALPD